MLVVAPPLPGRRLLLSCLILSLLILQEVTVNLSRTHRTVWGV